VTTGIEDGVETFLLDAVKANSFVKLGFRSGVLLEPARKFGPEFGLITLGIERGMPPFGEASVISAPDSLKM